jgi:DNA-binding MarR family transcriptional regulator
MSTEISQLPRPPLIQLFDVALDAFTTELYERVEECGFGDIRPGHGCVFSNIDPDGSRLTEIAERARMTKQSVGEVASDLERRGYVERVPDPIDGRAKIIRLTERGREAQAVGRRLLAGLESDWSERFGEERVAALREALEVIATDQLAALPS